MSSRKMTVTIEHDGETYSGEVMRIKSTSLGYEDHGILTAWLHCEATGSGIGVGGYCLDQPKERRGTDHTRVGTAYGLDHLIRLMETVGVSSWEKLPGKDVIVLYPDNGSHLGMTASGIAGLLNDKVFIPKVHAESWLNAESVQS